MSKQVYEDRGFKNRAAYLNWLAEDSNNPELVFLLAEILGPEEDFDGLVTTLEDLWGEL